MASRARAKRRKRRLTWAAGLTTAALCAPGWDRVLTVPLVLGSVLLVPLATRGGRQVIPLAWRPRRRRMLRRQAGLEKRTQPPAWIRKVTYAADRHRCLGCRRSPRRDGIQLQWDHIVPWAFGGLTSLWNGGTLCAECNLVKSSYWKSDSGKVYYRGFALSTSKHRAGQITRREMRARVSVLRWVRAGLAYQAMMR